MSTGSLFELAFRNDGSGIRAAVASGADPAATEPSGGHTPLQVASAASALDAASALIEAGACPNQRFAKQSVVSGRVRVGQVALMYARNKELVLLLARAGADLDAADGDGWTALAIAVENCDSDVVQTLLSLGASPELKGGVLAQYGSLSGLCKDKLHHLNQLRKLEKSSKIEKLILECEMIDALLDCK